MRRFFVGTLYPFSFLHIFPHTFPLLSFVSFSGFFYLFLAFSLVAPSGGLLFYIFLVFSVLLHLQYIS